MLHNQLVSRHGATLRPALVTHEQYVGAVAALAAARLNAEDRAKLDSVKLTYGAGPDGVRGVTYYNRWQGKGPDDVAPFVAVCGTCQENWVQLAGTTLHELGHVLAGFGAGHGHDWHEACERLGLRKVRAAGTVYSMAMFEPRLRSAIAQLPRPTDGQPVNAFAALPGDPFAFFGPLGRAPRLKPCGAGIGTRGGKSRGKGSGSRLALWHCECVPPVKVRVASRTEFAAHCDHCRAAFFRHTD